MAVENELLALAFRDLSELGFEVWIRNGCGLDRCFLSVFGIIARQHFALFLWQKSSIALPQIRHSTQNAILTKLSTWEYGNGDALFSRQNPAEFHIYCAMAHQQGFMPVYTAHANMLVLGQAEAPQSIKHVDTCRIHEKTDVTWWHGLRRSHRGDYAHSMTWICTYSKCLEHILMPQGQKHSWLKRVTHVAMRVHHTKCTITHPHTRSHIYIYIHTHTHIYTHTHTQTHIHHAQCYQIEQKNKIDIANVPRVWPSKVSKM